MAQVILPVSITYETSGVTPLSELIKSLQATQALLADSVGLLPSLKPGVQIESYSINVKQLTQESPLREVFLVSLFLAFQDDLEEEVPPIIENLFNVSISDKYDTLLTAAFLMLAFYGVGLAKDVAEKLISRGLIKDEFQRVCQDVAQQTGMSTEQVEEILKARYDKPNLFKNLLRSSVDFFIPSRRDNNAPLVVDRRRIEPPVVSEVPYQPQIAKDQEFEKYTPYEGVDLEIQAKDKSRPNTGWAAYSPIVAEGRLKMKIVKPLVPGQLWGRESINADIVVVSRLTGEGFQPVEIQVHRIND